MKINNNCPALNFGVKLKTTSVLETTSLKIFASEGTNGYKEVILALYDKPFKAAGSRGYRYYAEIIGKKIIDKYPQIKKATENIHQILKTEPNINKKDLNLRIQPIVDELGHEIDIIL